MAAMLEHMTVGCVLALLAQSLCIATIYLYCREQLGWGHLYEFPIPTRCERRSRGRVTARIGRTSRTTRTREAKTSVPRTVLHLPHGSRSGGSPCTVPYARHHKPGTLYAFRAVCGIGVGGKYLCWALSPPSQLPQCLSGVAGRRAVCTQHLLFTRA